MSTPPPNAQRFKQIKTKFSLIFSWTSGSWFEKRRWSFFNLILICRLQRLEKLIKIVMCYCEFLEGNHHRLQKIVTIFKNEIQCNLIVKMYITNSGEFVFTYDFDNRNRGYYFKLWHTQIRSRLLRNNVLLITMFIKSNLMDILQFHDFKQLFFS